MATAAKYQLYTFDDFCALVPDKRKADLIDGVIFMASPDNVEHFDLFLWLAHLIRDYLSRKGLLGKILGSRVAFRIDGSNSPEPDLAFLRPERLHLVRRGFVDGPPDWAVEIISPESIERDYHKKRKQYQKAGVPEYRIVDLLVKRLTCLRLNKSGEYRKVKPQGDIQRCQAIPGFWVRPSWLWETPLLDKDEVLNEILES